MGPIQTRGTPSAPESPTPPQTGKEPAEPASEQDQDAFENAMKGDRTGERGGDQPQTGTGPLTDLQGMLAAVARGGDSAPMGPPIAPVQAATPAGPLQAVQDVADRILVAAPPPGSDRQEVRISLKEGVLPDTEIQIVREGNSVSVTFRTENVSSNHFLNAHRSDLEQRLADRLHVEVNVSLDYQQQQQDGRSRGQRNLYEEMEDNR